MVAALATAVALATGASAAGQAPDDGAALVAEAEALSKSDPERAARLAEQALTIAEANGDPAAELEALTTIGAIALDRDRPGDAAEALERALALAEAEKLTDHRGFILRALGDARYRLGAWDAALADYLDALEWYQTAGGDGDRLRVGHLDVVIGNLLRRVGDRDKAIEYYSRAREVYSDRGYDAGVAGADMNLGNVLQELERYEEALAAFRAAGEVAERIGDDVLRSMVWNNTGAVLLEMDRVESALERFRASLELSRALGRTRGEAHALLKIGDAHSRSGRYHEAVAALREALPLAEGLDDAVLRRDVHEQLADALEGLGDAAGALEHLRRATELDRRLLDEARLQEIERLEAVRLSERREREIEALRRERRADRRARAALVAALVLAVAVIGLLVVGFRHRVRAADEIRDANARLEDAYRRVDELSRTDPLTGLPNRRGALPRIEQEIARSARSARPFAVAVIDLDSFKLLNDRHGHLVGDRVLEGVARLLRSSIRRQDVVCRWGGDELLLLLPETDLRGARTVCETLRQAVAAGDLGAGEPGRSVTVTVGVAECGGDDGVDSCLQRADAALYRGKSAGRNAVAV